LGFLDRRKDNQFLPILASHLLVELKLSVGQLEIERFAVVLQDMRVTHTLAVLRILAILLLVEKTEFAREMEVSLSMLSSLMLGSQQVTAQSANVLPVTQAIPS